MATAVAAAPRSPATSPRLPSPPPFPEVQLPPKSPGMPASDSAPSSSSAQYIRRIRPGSRADDMLNGPPLVPLNELDSPFQLQEHLKSLHAFHTRSPSSTNATQPITRATSLEIARPPNSSVDRSLWLYELTRFLVCKANDLIVSFFSESPPCSASTCPEMRASEWQYLCAVHEPPKPCCAIDYSCHTLDWAAYTLTSQKHFPSRLTLSEGQGGVRQLTNIMRRVYRIFAHAWFSHRQTFWEVESSQGLYCLFKTVCDVYGLIPEENYTIPKEAEGGPAAEEEEQVKKDISSPKKSPAIGSPEKKAKDQDNDQATGGAQAGTATALRRHKATPSLGSAVTTIHEGDEEENKEANGNPALGGMVDQLTKNTATAAPLAAISKTAEKMEVPPVPVEDAPEAKPEEKGESEEAKTSDPPTRAEEAEETSTPLSSKNSADSLATTVKVEEKASDEE